MTLPPYRAVLFDFDYTLADGTPGIFDCFCHAFGALGLPPPGRDAVRATVGMTLADAFASLRPGAGAEAADRFVGLFRNRADQVLTAGTDLFPDALPLLDGLRRAGVRTGVVSTKFRFRIEDLLRKYGRADAADILVGGEDVKAHKPHPEGLLLALDRLDTPPGRALFVGDTVIDAQAAQRAGIPFAAVLTGTTGPDAFAPHPRVGLFDNLTGLGAWLGL